jgi:hypothetical protein
MRRLILALVVALTPATVLAQPPVWPSGSPVSLASQTYVIPGPFVSGAGVANGPILCTDGSASAPSCGAYALEPTTGFFRAGASTMRATLGGNERFQWNTTGYFMGSGITLSWGDAATIVGAGAFDVNVSRDLAAVLALKNAANAQTFRIYGTTTGPKFLSLSHDGTNGVIDTAASAGLVSIAPTNATSVTLGKKVSSYNGTTTAGQGLTTVVGSGRATAQSAANASVSTFTVGAADGTFEVSANVLVTTATTHTFTVECAYTDEGNTARTLTLPFTLVAGSAIVTSVANANGAVPYMGLTMHLRAKASTTITVRTQAAGTYTTVTYNVEGLIRQIS